MNDVYLAIVSMFVIFCVLWAASKAIEIRKEIKDDEEMGKNWPVEWAAPKKTRAKKLDGREVAPQMIEPEMDRS